MNILIPHTWLLEHLETEAKPEEIQTLLSLAGPSVERINRDDKTKEAIYDIEITTNRVDVMSVRGLAREVAVILSHFGILAKLKKLTTPLAQDLRPDKSILLPLPKIHNDPKLSKRLMCVVLDRVEQTPTPDWMAKRLKQIEMNVHNSAIDITNYVTHELGHPCHAFDYDKLMETGGLIKVVSAKKGRTFTTLDGESYQTIGGEVAFVNQENEIIDLPSIKGTKNTSVDESTARILLLMESIVPEKVRAASMAHAIRTVAAQLMEKGVDPNLQDLVMGMAVKLYRDLCRAKIASEVFDAFPDKSEPELIKVNKSLIDQYLGCQLSIQVITDILTSLECRVEWTEKDLVLQVKPPTFRPDLTIGADLVEEIARIYGYHNLPSQLMATPIPTNYPMTSDFKLEHRVKEILANFGWQEIYSYSIVSEEIARQSGKDPSQHLKLINPLSSDREYLRQTHLPSLLEVLINNPAIRSLSVFELANIYIPRENDLPQELLTMSLLSTENYRKVRGVVESLFEKLFVRAIDFRAGNSKQKVEIWLGRSETDLMKAGSIEIYQQQMVAVQIDWQTLLLVSNRYPAYQSPSGAPALIEDLTFTLTETTKIGAVLKTIGKTSKLINKVEYKDSYEQNHTFKITYQSNKPLTSERIEPIRQKIVDEVVSAHQAKLVGEI